MSVLRLVWKLIRDDDETPRISRSRDVEADAKEKIELAERVLRQRPTGFFLGDAYLLRARKGRRVG